MKDNELEFKFRLNPEHFVTVQEFATFCEAIGFKPYHISRMGVVYNAARRFGYKVKATECLTNENKIGVHVELWRIEIEGGPQRPNVNLEVVGEPIHDHWAKLAYYSLNVEQFVFGHEELIEDLRLAWEAVCRRRQECALKSNG